MKQRKSGCYIAAVLLAGLMLGGCGNPNAKANTAESVSASDSETVSESEEIVSAEAETEKIYLLADTDDVAEGDIVAYRQPYYVVDGDNGVLMRRVERVLQDEMVLSCDANLTEDQETTVRKEDILGKVILF